jgi:hypothetical protein
VPIPCGEKPDNVPVPCFDAKGAIHTPPPAQLPHQDITPLPPPSAPIVITKIEAPKSVAPSPPPLIPRPAPPDTSVPQAFWSYQRDASCYHDGGSATQCFPISTLEQYASSRRQFEAQFQTGQVAGEAIGVLVRAWLEHRRKVNLERNDVRQQIIAYYNATFELNDEVMHEVQTVITTYTRLAKLAPAREATYEQAAEDSAKFNSRLAMLRPTSEKNLRGILAAKDINYLGRNLELAKSFYNLTFEGTKKEYVFSQLIQGLIGHYEFQQDRLNPSSP